MKALKEDYIGKPYGDLIIDDLFFKSKTFAICTCKCGNKTTAILSNLKNGHTKSCGCKSVKTRFSKNTKRTIINNFSKITPESMYWAGFLFGDGCISDNGKLQIDLTNQLGCIQHLQNLSIFLFNKDHTLKYKDRCVLQVTDENIAKNLEQFGIIPRKTYNGTIIIPTIYSNHFIRGYFDADGWISIIRQIRNNKSYNHDCLGICSYNPQNLEIILKYLPHKKSVHKILNRNLYDIRFYNKNEIKDIANYLYGKPNLEYKWNKLCKLMNS
jgi:hypothetical protein